MIKIERDTNQDLMNHILALVKKSGNYDKAGKNMDYFIAENKEVRGLTNYEFDFLAVANFGGSEGIYLDCWLKGSFDENHQNESKTISCGTFKTLRGDLEAMKVMGELAGSLTYYARQYVNREIDRYTPFKERLFEEYRRETEKDKKEGGTYKVKTYQTNVICPQCGSRLYTSDVYPYSFRCLDCDENFYSSDVKLPQSGTVMLKVPFKRPQKAEAMKEAYQIISKKNHCSQIQLSGSVLNICWDYLPETESVRNVVIGIDIYMENYKHGCYEA